MNRRRSCSEWASMSELCMLSMTSNVIQQHTVYVRVSVTAIEERIHTLSLRGNLVWSKVAVAVLCLHCWQQWLCLSICAVSVFSVVMLTIVCRKRLGAINLRLRSSVWMIGWYVTRSSTKKHWLARRRSMCKLDDRIRRVLTTKVGDMLIHPYHHIWSSPPLSSPSSLFITDVLSYRRSAVYWVTKRSVKLKETEDVLLLALNDDDLDDDDESRAINHHISYCGKGSSDRWPESYLHCSCR